MLEILLAKDFHDHSHVLFIFILDSGTALKGSRFNSSLSVWVLAIGDTVLDTNTFFFVIPVMSRPHTILIGVGHGGE